MLTVLTLGNNVQGTDVSSTTCRLSTVLLVCVKLAVAKLMGLCACVCVWCIDFIKASLSVLVFSRRAEFC